MKWCKIVLNVSFSLGEDYVADGMLKLISKINKWYCYFSC